jgi:steroid delta-isomerase-like uncharacterized protein
MTQPNQALRNKHLASYVYEEIFNKRNFHLLDEIVHDEFVDHNPEPGQPAGREGVKAMMRTFVEAFPDLHFSAEGDLVAARCTVTGTHEGTFAGIPATGRKATVTGVDWIRFKDGKFVERWGIFDLSGMLQQLGAMPGPSTDELKKLSKSYYEALDATKGDFASMKDKFFDPSCMTYFNGQGPLPLDAVAGMMAMFWGAFPDLKHSLTGQICEGDTVLNRMDVTATHKGTFMGIAATNKPMKVSAISSHRFANGKIAEQHLAIEMMAVLQAIGAVPTP